ncbi:MAG: SusC/RagA family TonB-linked outer membrane protein, partial [Flavobacteriaceae bacterium]|nr:SusC/RagA family TonB-linked outer membrane protein [Flavobacteriaceae bacterium]
MSVKLKTLTAGVLFFTGQALMAQETNDSLKIEKAKEIDEIVVVGYSRVKKTDYVGTVSKVDMGSVKNKNVSSATQALAGESAGVQIVSSTGQPGQDPTVRIRGFGSVNGNREPLYVVDGVPFSGNISSINPEDIDNYTILKDATATAIYGSRGANGVVVITTKSGRANRDYIQLESKVGINTQLLPRYDVITSPEEYIELAWSALYHQGVANKIDNPIKFANENLFGDNGIALKYNMWKVNSVADLIDPETGKVRSEVERKYTPENWAKKTFRPAMRTEHNLNMGGGSGRTTYYAGIGYLKDDGYSINSNFERYTGRLNIGFRPKKWLSGTFNMGYAHTKSRNNGQSENSNSVFWFSDNIPPIYPLYLRDENGDKILDPHYGGYQFDYGIGRGFGALTNAVGDATYNKLNFTRHELNANLFLKADITKGLSFETRIGGQYYNNNRDNLVNPFYGSSAGQKGSISKSKSELFTWTFLQMLRYNKRFGGHGIDAFVAHESTKWENKILGAQKQGLISPNIAEFNNAVNASGTPESYINDYALDSYFGQLNYDYEGKYILSSSIRRDGSSRFLKGNRYDVFPSLG